MTDADLIRAKLEFETDAPVPNNFRRDQHLTDVALFKAKVLAVLADEQLEWQSIQLDQLDRALVEFVVSAIGHCRVRIEAIKS